MTDQLAALIARSPGLERASRLNPTRIPVLPAFEELLPERGLRPGSMVCVGGVGATSLAMALVGKASENAWTAVVGLPDLGLRAATELGLDLDKLVVVEDPGTQWTNVLAALIDAFDIVLACPKLPGREARRIAGRVRERDAVLVTIGPWDEADVRLAGTKSVWHGIGRGHGHLAARTLEVNVTGRRAAARSKTATLWLPDAEGEVRIAAGMDGASVVPLRNIG